MKTISLTPVQLQWCYEKAWDRFVKYDGNPHENYHNSDHSHRLGFVGELATYYLLKRNGVSVKANFNSDDTLPDLVSNSRSIEIKTWAEHNWDFYGRCVSERQYPKIKDYSFIIWVTAPHLPEEVPDENWPVTIRGYSTPSDFAGVEPREMGPRKILNRQLPPSAIRDIDILMASLR